MKLERDDIVIALGLGCIIGGAAIISVAIAVVLYGLILLGLAYVLAPARA